MLLARGFRPILLISMKFYYLIAIPLIFLLGSSQSPQLRVINWSALSGNISITLKHGVWKLWEKKPVYQDITLDLVCTKGRCDREVWGYAPKFNQDVDHSGTVEVINVDNSWRLKVKMNIQSHPWQTEVKEANYEIELIPHQDKLIGNYVGSFNDRSIEGKVTGSISPYWPVPISNHQPLSPREHPRLIFRTSQLPNLREKAKTPAGEAIIAQLEKTLTSPIYYDGYVPNGGYHAAGHCFLSLLQQNPQAAETAWQIVEKSMQQPGRRLLEKAPIVAGVALAYDLCYPAWNQERLKKVTRWLASEAAWLTKGDSPTKGWNSNSWSNWNARARGASGLAALAILDEPEEFFLSSGNPKSKTCTEGSQCIQNPKFDNPYRLLKISERNIKRYLTLALGDHGFGTEGDHYTTEPWVLTVIPFVQAYKNVIGQDLVAGSSAEWFLPHYLMRIVNQDGKLSIPTYGRHRSYAGGSLFALGLVTVPEAFLPGVMDFFNRYLGREGDKSFGINSPYQAAFALMGYRDDIVTKNPAEIWQRVLVDQQKGFYVFRNRWQDRDDFVASIYLKKESLNGSWSFPDVGSFRIFGLGGRWANAGLSDVQPENENVVFMPNTRAWKSSQPIAFQSSLNGSGIVSLRTDNIVFKKSKNTVGIGLIRSFAVDYSGMSGSPGLFVIVDKFIGKVDEPIFNKKTWIMHTEGEVKIADQSVTIEAVNGATLKATFIAPSQVKILFEKEKQGGKILATGGNEFFVVMTVQQGKAPKMKISGTGLDAQVQVGKQEISFQEDRIILDKF